MKTNWRPSEELQVQKMIGHLRKQNMTNDLRKFYSKSLNDNQIWVGMDKEQKSHYEKTLKRQLNYFEQEEFKKQKQVETLMHKLLNREQCVEYFSWQGHKLLFKGKELNLNPEKDPQNNPFHLFNQFDRKAFISWTFDDILPSHAEMDIDKVKLVRRAPPIRLKTQPLKRHVKEDRKYNLQVDIPKKENKRQGSFHRTNTINYLRSPMLNVHRKISHRVSPLRQLKTEQMQRSFWVECPIPKLQLHEDTLIQNLKIISENPSVTKNSIRVYKQQWRAVFIERYGKDNLTGFLCIDYISDYKQIEELIRKILSMDDQLVRFMCFNMLDSNQDGQIADSDLFNLLEYSKDNPLLEQDYLTMARYFVQNQHQPQTAKSQQLLLWVSQPTYISFITQRNLRTQKEKQQGRPKDRREPKLFYLHESFQNNSTQSIRFKRKVSKKKERSTQSNTKKTLTYQVYKQIFKSKIPMMFYDLLYVMGGIQKPGTTYLKLKQPCVAADIQRDMIQENCESRRHGYLELRDKMRRGVSKLPVVRS